MGTKRRRKRLILMMTVIGMLLAQLPLPVFAAGSGCDIEQVSIYMPEVRMYYRASEPESSYEAYLGGEKLVHESTSLFSDTQAGTDYYLLLDVSASIPSGKFENLKNGISQFISTKGPNDRCILLTFGNESRVVLNGGEDPNQAVQTVSGLTNTDMETVLFQTIVQAANMIDAEAQNEAKRRVIVAITDGDDCVTGRATANEAQTTLKDKGIPLYAVAVDVGREDYINSFGEFARNTGGTLEIYSQGESLDTLNRVRDTVNGSYVTVFRSKTNKASNEREDFTVKFLDHKVTETREVIPTRWTADKGAPEVVSVRKKGDQKIVIKFSESVENADRPGNYQVSRDGKDLAVDSVLYKEKKGYVAVLTFEETLYKGEYTISFSNITDASMEKNALTEPYTVELDGPRDFLGRFVREHSGLIAVLALLLLAAIIAAAVVIYRKIRDNRGVIYVDGKATLASNVDVKQHVSTAGLPRMNVRLIVRDRINGSCELKVTVNGSAMVGRSSDCDVYFDDPKMSRQHFVLETDGSQMYITDLETKNGTFVNGIRINMRRKLASGDEISAGEVQARILW